MQHDWHDWAVAIAAGLGCVIFLGYMVVSDWRAERKKKALPYKDRLPPKEDVIAKSTQVLAVEKPRAPQLPKEG